MIKTMKKYIYQIWFGLKFEKGYRYKRIGSSDLNLLEMNHTLLLLNGWERYSDVQSGLFNAYCWYRKK